MAPALSTSAVKKRYIGAKQQLRILHKDKSYVRGQQDYAKFQYSAVEREGAQFGVFFRPLQGAGGPAAGSAAGGRSSSEAANEIPGTGMPEVIQGRADDAQTDYHRYGVRLARLDMEIQAAENCRGHAAASYGWIRQRVAQLAGGADMGPLEAVIDLVTDTDSSSSMR
ncbi:hypothetical protein GPECTOR_32g526 [Gonium pectorale]|uniref:Uncharacterized protein n=1 Tax=Gonium pectorale TaxID=33097 RepID=A0A150GDQ8_GONPE|nr:hypothetical protein GPECTOR_32g526 [Gonium pectorale]|eukprot:KXZ47913.1 hypothetical protein GPECTOR_32g526 [Gonium pectorale]